MSRPSVLIFYDYFFPAKKAGGIVQSLRNIAGLLGDQFDLHIVTSAYEFGSGLQLEVQPDTWQDYQARAKVIYLSKNRQAYSTYKNILQAVNPSAVYFNGIFSIRFFMLPLLVCKKLNYDKVIIAPRGMLQEGALAIKPQKKRLYFFFLKNLFPLQRYTWHATDITEKQDIERFLNNSKVNIVNVPVLPRLPDWEQMPGRFSGIKDELKLVTISLITRKKNILWAIQALKQVKNNKKITYHIYGPVKDESYWDECQKAMAGLPPNVQVTYKGAISPEQVQYTLAAYHVYLLPTAGENFGHSIFEALASETPVIISSKTPFTAVAEKNAGWVADSVENIVTTIEHICNLSGNELVEIGLNARNYAVSEYYSKDYTGMYTSLFTRQR